MKLQRCKYKGQEAYIIELTFAILILIIGTIVIYQLARVIKNVTQPRPGTNATSFVHIGYETMYQLQEYTPSITKTNQDPYPPAPPSFTFSYILCPAGQCRVIVNTTNEYKVFLNLSTNSYSYDFDLVTGQEQDVTNETFDMVIYKSLDLSSWQPLATNYSVDPSKIYQFTDNNATNNAAFYYAAP